MKIWWSLYFLYRVKMKMWKALKHMLFLGNHVKRYIKFYVKLYYMLNFNKLIYYHFQGSFTLNSVTSEQLKFVVFIIIPRRKVDEIILFSLTVPMTEYYSWKGQVEIFWLLAYFEQTTALIFSLTQQTKPCSKLLLTYFSLAFFFYTPWKHKKLEIFWCFQEI